MIHKKTIFVINVTNNDRTIEPLRRRLDSKRPILSYLGGVYMDGELESRQGFDCVDILNPEDFLQTEIKDVNGVVVNNLAIHNLKGIYRCKVYGESEPCTCYVWTIRRGPTLYNGHEVYECYDNYGFIFLDSDHDARQYALKHYKRFKNRHLKWKYQRRQLV